MPLHFRFIAPNDRLPSDSIAVLLLPLAFPLGYAVGFGVAHAATSTCTQNLPSISIDNNWA